MNEMEPSDAGDCGGRFFSFQGADFEVKTAHEIR